MLWAPTDDGAGGVLTHMYGKNLIKPTTMDGSGYSRDSECKQPRASTLIHDVIGLCIDPWTHADLITFDQSAYWINATHPELKNPNLPRDGSGGTSDLAYAFIPPACKKAAGGKPCRMHLYHHGCVSTGCCRLSHAR